MNVKNFLLAGIAGGITDFLLGWLFYGIVFRDFFGGPEPNLTYIFAGCMCFGFLTSYIFVRWANIVTWMTGAKAGAGIGVLMGLMDNFFKISMDGTGTVDQKFGVDVLVCTLIAIGVGIIVAVVNGGLSKSAT